MKPENQDYTTEDSSMDFVITFSSYVLDFSYVSWFGLLRQT